jgi:hypothetical protein
MSKLAIIITVLVVVVAAGLYFVFGMQADNKDNTPATQQADPNYVEYVDSVNHVRFMHHKDWQVTSSFGYVRLIPKTQADFMYLQLQLWAPESRVAQLNFPKDSSVDIDSDTSVRVKHEEIQWKDSTGKPTNQTTKTYLHLAESVDRDVILELESSQQIDVLDPRIKKVIETLQFE